jgi:PhnB protein
MSSVTRMPPKNPPIAPDAPSIQPTLSVADVATAVRFYRALGFDTLFEVPGGDDGLAYAILRHGATYLHVAPLEVPDASDPEWVEATKRGPRGLGVQLYAMVDDVEGHFVRAQQAGLEVLSGPKDEFWGDRVFTGRDPFGYVWSFAEHVRDVSPEEMQQASQPA